MITDRGPITIKREHITLKRRVCGRDYRVECSSHCVDPAGTRVLVRGLYILLLFYKCLLIIRSFSLFLTSIIKNVLVWSKGNNLKAKSSAIKDNIILPILLEISYEDKTSLYFLRFCISDIFQRNFHYCINHSWKTYFIQVFHLSN